VPRTKCHCQRAQRKGNASRRLTATLHRHPRFVTGRAAQIRDRVVSEGPGAEQDLVPGLHARFERIDASLQRTERLLLHLRDLILDPRP
jgi:hypothetical protein